MKKLQERLEAIRSSRLSQRKAKVESKISRTTIMNKLKDRFPKTPGHPQGARYNRTRHGWMDRATFEEWFGSHIFPILKLQLGKKVVIEDNLTSYISLNVLRLYQETDESASDKNQTALPKNQFPVLLKKALNELQPTASQNIISCFGKADIVPINVEELESFTSSRSGGTFKDDCRKKINVASGQSIYPDDIEEAKILMYQKQNSSQYVKKSVPSALHRRNHHQMTITALHPRWKAINQDIMPGIPSVEDISPERSPTEDILPSNLRDPLQQGYPKAPQQPQPRDQFGKPLQDYVGKSNSSLEFILQVEEKREEIFVGTTFINYKNFELDDNRVIKAKQGKTLIEDKEISGENSGVAWVGQGGYEPGWQRGRGGGAEKAKHYQVPERRRRRSTPCRPPVIGSTNLSASHASAAIADIDFDDNDIGKWPENIDSNIR
ncbi:hypothetical protein ILUMI_00194 [Ignelater luminosus]|uniref:DDE-1 domain-containing protein n=1 Tax=Ignelater luminosus TaxID=2038154 RepID=A0A8K0DKQ0_IGNLU|nr:hypothetical protein ILUMI_00194 [Ignelater luminosus]